MVNAFDVFVTVDQHLRYQQAVNQFDLILVVLVAANNRLETLTPLIPQVEELLQNATDREIIEVRQTSSCAAVLG